MVYFLFTNTDLYNLNSKVEFFAITENSKNLYLVEFELINKKSNVLISFDTFKIIESIRQLNEELKANLIDVSQIFKLIIGRPTKELTYLHPSTVDKIFLHYNLIAPSEVPELIDILGSKFMSDKPTIQIHSILLTLKKVYHLLLLDLKKQGEFDRYFQVELPVCQILYKREIAGIKISKNKLEQRLTELDKQEISCKNQLRYEYKIIDETDNGLIIRTLISEKLNYLAENLQKVNIEHILKIGSENNELLYLLYNLKKAKKDKTFLLRFGAFGVDRIFPVFDCIGTITSRILVREPLIQQLRKSTRDIFIPDLEKAFVYADFGQFEPGILADKSKDKILIGLYNSGDIYEGLSITIFGNKENRKAAKMVFLSYMYGMSIENLTSLINELFPQNINDLKNKLESFFYKFKSLMVYKKELEIEFLHNNKIGTSMGNYRYGDLPENRQTENPEVRWLLSQKIQGTASLILKRSILKLQKHPEIEFLIPMHDAVLFQVPTVNISFSMNLIRQAFTQAFKEECPKINPKVNFGGFNE